MTAKSKNCMQMKSMHQTENMNMCGLKTAYCKIIKLIFQMLELEKNSKYLLKQALIAKSSCSHTFVYMLFTISIDFTFLFYALRYGVGKTLGNCLY